MNHSCEHLKRGGIELLKALECLPPVDIILSEVKLMRDILPKVKIMRDTALIYGFNGIFDIEGEGQGVTQEPSISIQAFESSGYTKWWNLSIKSEVPNDKRTDKNPSNFNIRFSKGRPVLFSVKIKNNPNEGNMIEGGFFKVGSNRLQTMTLLEGYLSYTYERLAEKIKKYRN